ncbi:hypothetical protein NDU88_001226 [Pleurodeles waltl]|uniref:Uncharacterized protein n=1 Tax=Pleurodeles waltl TaxID=8319 RepID=A0AAV7R7Y8_PLEWA|nr:hypothetical protein NDU88_001226 [Pleurodeles waltl]
MRRYLQAAPADHSGEQPTVATQHSQIGGQIKASGPRCKNPSAGGPIREASSLRPRLYHQDKATALQRPKSCEAAVRSNRRSGLEREAPVPPSVSLQCHREQRGPAGPASHSAVKGRCKLHRRRPRSSTRPVPGSRQRKTGPQLTSGPPPRPMAAHRSPGVPVAARIKIGHSTRRN